MKRLQVLVAITLGSFWLVSACLVPNKSLVDELPGAGGDVGQAGAQSSGNSNVGADAGAGDVSNGGSGAAGGSGSAGTEALGGASGSGGTGTSGSSNTVGGAPGGGWHFTGSPACTASNDPFCDDFEKANTKWPVGVTPTRTVIADAPSGTHVMETSFSEVPLMFDGTAFNLSFWVRFPSLSDQAFLSWEQPVGRLSFGLEHSAFRFQLGVNPPQVAPELAQYTRSAVADTWTCVEIDSDGASATATVTVFGEAPVELAELGGAADAGIDQKLLQAIPGQGVMFGSPLSVGEKGANIQIDDLRVVAQGQTSVCDEFVAANH